MTEAIGGQGYCRDCINYDKEEKKCKETDQYTARKKTCEKFK